MDEWAFLTLAKTKSDLLSRSHVAPLNSQEAERQQNRALSKADTARALDYEVAEQHAGFRGIVSFAIAALINAAFFGAVELTALDARTPGGDVVVADVDHDAHDTLTAAL